MIRIEQLQFSQLPNFAFKQNNSILSSDLEIIDALKNNNYLSGSYSIISPQRDGSVLLCRDPIGSRKLFYTFDSCTRKLYVSSNFIMLGQRLSFDKIRSVPAGGYIIIQSTQDIRRYNVDHQNFGSEFKLGSVSDRLKDTFNYVSKCFNRKGLICLSGGLDSTVVAYLAKSYFPDLKAVCTVFVDDLDFDAFSICGKLTPNKYHDFDRARRIAKSLGIALEPIVIRKSEMLLNLQEVLLACQDWRDFNVHCATLNFFTARYISNNIHLRDRVILTGDFMNEIFADYTSEFLNGEEFYKQPVISKSARQRFLIRGLESSDRELGVFSYFGLTCVQPYITTIEIYKELRKDILELENAKYEINGTLLPDPLLNLVGQSKVRAQTGDETGGILGHYVRNGFTQDNLRVEFVNCFDCPREFLNDFIIAGRYKT